MWKQHSNGDTVYNRSIQGIFLALVVSTTGLYWLHDNHQKFQIAQAAKGIDKNLAKDLLNRLQTMTPDGTGTCGESSEDTGLKAP